MASADSVTLGEVQQVGRYAFSWRVQNLLSRTEKVVMSPVFRANGFELSLRHSTQLRPKNCSTGTYINLHLQARASGNHWPTAVFQLGMRCVDKSLPDMQQQCSICPAAPLGLWRQTAHAFRADVSDWGYADMREGLDGLRSEDTLEYWVCFESLDKASCPCSISSCVSLSPSHETTLDTAQFWSSPDFSDCTVCTENGRTLPCHKSILCAASPVLRAMFTSSSAMSDASSNSITIREAEPEVVELLLKAIYCMTVDVPCHLFVALFKLADQYQVAGVKDLLLQELRARPLLPDATAVLLPQSHALGTTTDYLTTNIITQAANHVEDLIQQLAFLQEWQLAHVQLLLSKLQPSKARSALTAATTWACGGSPEQEQERIQQWPLLQDSLQSEHLTVEDLKSMRDNREWYRRIEHLPGVTEALLFVMMEKVIESTV